MQRIQGSGSFLVICLLNWCLDASAMTYDPKKICDAAALQASETWNVPVRVLQTISRVETGRKRSGEITPWPWAVNREGKGTWFKTEAEAIEFAKDSIARGMKSIDVGCFQINYRWHGSAFVSVEDMFNPVKNASYAAKFLFSLFAETGNWPDAAGLYHSRSQALSQKYRARFVAQYTETMPIRRPTPIPDGSRAPANVFPQLVATAKPSILGSLFQRPAIEKVRPFIALEKAN